MSREKKELKPVPEVGKLYHFWDDGKTGPSRHYICKVEELVTSDGGVYRFVTTKCGYAQCIPFEGNEHLLGTTNMPSEEFINW